MEQYRDLTIRKMFRKARDRRTLFKRLIVILPYNDLKRNLWLFEKRLSCGINGILVLPWYDLLTDSYKYPCVKELLYSNMIGVSHKEDYYALRSITNIQIWLKRDLYRELFGGEGGWWCDYVREDGAGHSEPYSPLGTIGTMIKRKLKLP